MRFVCAMLAACLVSIPSLAADNPPASQPAGNKMPHIQVDVKKKQVRVECEAVNAEMPLELFCCTANSKEHEAVLRSSAKPSQIHLALLLVGLQPGEPLRFSKAMNKWLPPKGPPLHITCEFEKDNKQVSIPAYRMMRNTKSKKEMPPMTWVFTGSRLLDEGQYAADITGEIVTVVNFEMSMIDVPDLASSSNETLEWEVNPGAVPNRMAKVTMVIEPAGQPAKAADKGQGAVAGASADAQPAESVKPATNPAQLSEVQIDEARVKQLKQRWEKSVAPFKKELATAAQTHYEVISALRREQQRLIDEADRIQRVIDELQKQYQDMTTPRPEE